MCDLTEDCDGGEESVTTKTFDSGMATVVTTSCAECGNSLTL
jgi:hypothetical protein